MITNHPQNLEDLSLLLFSPSSLQLHLQQAVTVLESVAASAPTAETMSAASSPTQTPSGPSPSRALNSATHEEASGTKRVHPRETAARQYPYNGKKVCLYVRTRESARERDSFLSRPGVLYVGMSHVTQMNGTMVRLHVCGKMVCLQVCGNTSCHAHE